ncbi:hypothetical protein OG779_19250 [Streptomyces sp. NBC_01563]
MSAADVSTARPRRGPHPRRPFNRPAQPALHDTPQSQIWLEIIQIALDRLEALPNPG